MAGREGTPITGVPKDLTRDELTLAFRVIEALRGIRFGSVQVLVHDGKVVQIDVAEKLRLREPPAPTSGAVRDPGGG
jgi:hypothetical protein